MTALPISAAPNAATGGMLGLMWKTVSSDCNLACDYCYYSAGSGPRSRKLHRIESALLEKVIREYMQASNGAVGFAWQGGEPLLAGLGFFEQVVALQIRHAPPNTRIGNAVQTNGTLITDRWARFFREYRFLVGVSVDGPREVHDARRVTRAGRGTFDLVMRGIGHLRRHDVDFNILTVLHQGNIGRADELMAFYAREGFHYVQFIPGMDFHARQSDVPARYLVTPEEYGDFLCRAFDIWFNDGAPRVSVRLFDDLLSVRAGREAGSCKHRPGCGRTLVLEQNGDVYPCDFYMGPERRLANLDTASLREIVEGSAYRDFLQLKTRLPRACRRCIHRDLCHGGCPRDRARDEAGGATGTDYFCAAHRRLFEYAGERLAWLARAMRTRWLIDHERAGRKWPGRNDPCICGGGAKFKRCCAPLWEELCGSMGGARLP
ncbi:MAG: anaerobic sulfatase maturase [Burkholderiales bacterium]|nr:anaerobic sulfatase maturase [Burkholderiales bacterium]